MSKQLMIYTNIQPLKDIHKGWSVDIQNFEFMKDVSSVPLLASEFVFASQEYPIIFVSSADGFPMPLAIMGLHDDKNLLLDENNQFTVKYVPAFVRRFPFVLGGTPDTDTMTVCIDEDAECVIKDGTKGSRLFDDSGEQSEQFKGLIEFLKDYHLRSEQTRLFTERLKELDLFEPMSANISYEGKKPLNINLSGFSIINMQKLKALADDVVLELFKNGGLEVIYAHVQSLNNFNKLTNLLSKKLREAESASEPAEATA